MPKVRTRLLDVFPKRRDDEEVLAVIKDLPRSRFAWRLVFCAGLLNEAGEVYREVHLYGEYEALQFTARMNACGFVRVPAAAPPGGGPYESVFAKP